MYELNGNGNTTSLNSNMDRSDDSNIPEPPEQWAIEDFSDILP
jgi:hypothetical protein